MFTGLTSVLASAYKVNEGGGDPDPGELDYIIIPPPFDTVPGSARFNNDGLGSYILLDPAPFVFGTNDFTIEWWQYIKVNAPYMRVFQQGLYDTTIDFGISIENDTLYIWRDNTYIATAIDPAKLKVWTHLAVTREGNYFRVFQDGVLLSTSSRPAWDFTNDTLRFAIGTEYGGPVYGANFNGWMADFHVINGRSLYNADFVLDTKFAAPQIDTTYLLRFDNPGNITKDSSVNNIVAVDFFNVSPGPSVFVEPYPSQEFWKAGTNTTLSGGDGKVRATSTTNNNNPRVVRKISGLSIGETYRVQATVYPSNDAGTVYFRVSNDSNLVDGYYVESTGSIDDTFVADASFAYLGIVVVVDNIGEYAEVDDLISVVRVP